MRQQLAPYPGVRAVRAHQQVAVGGGAVGEVRADATAAGTVKTAKATAVRRTLPAGELAHELPAECTR